VTHRGPFQPQRCHDSVIPARYLHCNSRSIRLISKLNQGDAPGPKTFKSQHKMGDNIRIWERRGRGAGSAAVVLTKSGAAVMGWGIKGRDFPGGGGGGERSPAKSSKGNGGPGKAGGCSGERSSLEAVFKYPFC